MEQHKIYGQPLLQYLAAASGDLAIVTDGMHYGWPSPSLPQILNNSNASLSLSNEQGLTLAVMPLIGAVFGAVTAAIIVDYLGRKKTIIITAVPFFISWLLIAFAQTPELLFIARFLAGVADGVTFTAVPMYIGEISDPNIRGMLGSTCSVSWIIGFLVINAIGSYLSISNTAIVSSVIPLVAALTFIWMPESPYFLLMKGKVEKAKTSITKFRKINDVNEEIRRMKTQIQSASENRGNVLDLFTVKSNRKAVIIVAGLRGFQQFSGTTAITFYAQDIFKQAGDDVSPETASIIYFSVQLAVTIISSSIVDRTGRKPLLIISMAGSCLALFLEGTYFYIRDKTSIDTDGYQYLAVVFLIFFTVIFSLGMQSVPICMLGELFPTSVKAYALCLADVYYSLVATVASKFLQLMKDSEDFGMYMAFYGFMVFSLIGLIFIIFVVPETKGKTLEEIQQFLKGEFDKNEVEEKECL